MADELSCVCRTRLGTAFELDASLRLPLDRAPITVLFGPSGAGKTTVLRMLAGLDRPLQGAIAFRGQTWFDAARGIFLAPQKRRAGYLAQDYALFPHLTVAANIAYAARPGKGREYLQAFGLADLAARHPRAISSGSVWRWPAHWPPSPRCCCSMSRFPRWTPPRARAPDSSCARCCSRAASPASR
jgi:molybdate transport system ATP-binding protein